MKQRMVKKEHPTFSTKPLNELLSHTPILSRRSIPFRAAKNVKRGIESRLQLREICGRSGSSGDTAELGDDE